MGKAWFRACGLSARDFQVLASMSSWATCAWRGWSAARRDAREGGAGDAREGDAGDARKGAAGDTSNTRDGELGDGGTEDKEKVNQVISRSREGDIGTKVGETQKERIDIKATLTVEDVDNGQGNTGSDIDKCDVVGPETSADKRDKGYADALDSLEKGDEEEDTHQCAEVAENTR